jgi:hypothetical protein
MKGMKMSAKKARSTYVESPNYQDSSRYRKTFKDDTLENARIERDMRRRDGLPGKFFTSEKNSSNLKSISPSKSANSVKKTPKNKRSMFMRDK